MSLTLAALRQIGIAGPLESVEFEEKPQEI
jgi:hypothetical protein